MISIHITKNNVPSPEQFEAMLNDRAGNEMSDVDVLAKLVRELTVFEHEHSMTSDLFYERFMEGEMGDAMPFIEWAGKYENQLKLKQRIEQKLKKLVILKQQQVQSNNARFSKSIFGRTHNKQNERDLRPVYFV